MNEIWMDVPEFEGKYKCSNLGRVKSLKRKGKRNEHILAERLDNYGYQQVMLCENGVMYGYRVHRLVALLFVSNPDNKPHVNHLDGNKSNPNFKNLEWCTHSENHKDAYLKGQKTMPITKLSKKDVLEIYHSKECAKILSKKYSIGKRNVYQIKIGQTWKHVTGGTHIPKKKNKING